MERATFIKYKLTKKTWYLPWYFVNSILNIITNARSAFTESVGIKKQDLKPQISP